MISLNRTTSRSGASPRIQPQESEKIEWLHVENDGASVVSVVTHISGGQ